MSTTPDDPAATAAPPGGTRGPFVIEQALARTTKTFFANMLPFLCIAAILEAPLIALNVLMQRSVTPGEPPQVSWWLLASTLLGIVTHYVIVGTLTYGVFKHLRNQPISWGECLARGLSKLPAALGTALLVGLATLVGYALCLVPGIYVYIVYAVAVPVAVVEGKSVPAAMARSKQLTLGRRWPIFGALLLVGLLVFVPAAVLGFTLATSPSVLLTLSSLWTILSVAFQSVLSCVIYYQLRETEEDLDAPELAAVFD
jgi:hypothetical protein